MDSLRLAHEGERTASRKEVVLASCSFRLSILLMDRLIGLHASNRHAPGEWCIRNVTKTIGHVVEGPLLFGSCLSLKKRSAVSN